MKVVELMMESNPKGICAYGTSMSILIPIGRCRGHEDRVVGPKPGQTPGTGWCVGGARPEGAGF